MDEAISNSADGLLVSLTTLAREFGISRDTVGRRLRNAGVRSTGERAGYPVFSLGPASTALVWADRPALAEGGNDPDSMSPTDRKAWYQSETSRLAVEKEEGTSVSADACRVELGTAVKIMIQMLETLPDILERDCGMGAEELAVLESSIRRVRADLAERLAA